MAILFFLSAIFSELVLSSFQLPCYQKMGEAVPFVTEKYNNVRQEVGGGRMLSIPIKSLKIKETLPRNVRAGIPSHPIH